MNMLALVGFLIGSLTIWIALKMLRWEKEEEVKDIIEDREIE